MSACKFTNKILPSECLGDSLEKINNNFSSLDENLCNQPLPLDGHGTSAQVYTTEQQKSRFDIAAENSIIYGTKFDSLRVCFQNNLSLGDGTSLQVTTFPYSSATIDTKPLATFSTASLTDKPPQVTFYYAASGSNTTTLYNLNSATSELNKGPIWFGDTVTALLSANNRLYVGGRFNQVGGNLSQRFAEINLSTQAGSYIANPITNLGSTGEVRKIVKTTAIQSSVLKDILALGGSFQSIGIRGRGLVVHNQTDNVIFPFYVNGEVNALYAIGEFLYVGGNFDYVNYGTSSLSLFSGQRLETNGLFAISLPGLLQGLTRGALSDRSSIFEGEAIVNDIVEYQNFLYIGGQFKIKESNQYQYQNLCSLTQDGSLIQTWKPITNGPVYTLHIDDNTELGDSVYLYIGGKFSRYYNGTQYYLQPRTSDSFSTEFHNAVAIKLTEGPSFLISPSVVGSWKPKFNDEVTKFASHDADKDTHVYCYGKFTSINEDSVNYLAAVQKASTFGGGQVLKDWVTSVPTSPDTINSALIRVNESLIVGGSFTKIGDQFRYRLARIADSDNVVLTRSLSSINWDFGAQLLTIGSPIALNLTSSTVQRYESKPLISNAVNAVTFDVDEEHFSNLTKGQPIRFFLRRPGNQSALGSLPSTNDTFVSNVNVLGWKVDFNR